VDEDEHDRRAMDKIRQRIEERKLVKEASSRRKDETVVKTSKDDVIPGSTKESRKESRKGQTQ